MLQSRSGCLFPKETAPRRGRRSRSWGCQVTSSRSAIPVPIASRGSRGLSENFIVVRDCGTIRPDFSGLSRSCWPRGISMCCCRSTNRDFCLRACGNGWGIASGWRCRASRATAPRTARPDSAGCSINWACRSRQRAIVKSESELRDAIRFPSVVKTSVGTASRGIWFVRNEADLEGALQELARDRTARSPTRCWCRNSSRARPRRRKAVFCRGKLLGFHAYRQIAAGAGGGEAIKQSVSRPGGARSPRDDRREARLARRLVGRLRLCPMTAPRRS